MKKYLLVPLIVCAFGCQAGKIASAFKALSIYDYFKARSLFYASLRKAPSEAGYGLATIYFRTDNPFSNIDSAAKYIRLSRHRFKDTAHFGAFHIMPSNMAFLSDAICREGYRQHSRHATVCDLNHFLETFYFAGDSLLGAARLLRDQLALQGYRRSSSSDSMRLFLLSYPESELFPEAMRTYWNFQYAEQTPHRRATEYQRFILDYPQNPNLDDAESRLFAITAQWHDADSLYTFIKRYSHASRSDAWRMLYSLAVPKASPGELDTFLLRYPDYPYRQDVEREIEWSKQDLLLLKDPDGRYGYADTSGSWIVKPVFDDAAAFREGFAGVCRNDSCYFINKSGEKTSVSAEEVFDYHNGLAIVKKQNRCYLINRSGQLISSAFEDISPASDGLFVARQNGLYGALNFKAETVIPFSYKKLGTFRNGYAYYLSEQYGLLSTDNRKLEARWDWISEIDANGLVVVKKDRRFGLMNLNEQLLLPPDFDYISLCTAHIYLVVRNNLYGFYDAANRCYISDLAYDYRQGFDPGYYTNGRQFKLIKENETALMDANGRISIPFGMYTDVFFAKDDLIRIQKGKKFGYVDRKLKAVTAVEFDKASDFENHTAIISKAGTAQLIGRNGKALFVLKDGTISRTNESVLKTSLNGLEGLIGPDGELLLPSEFTELQALGKGIWSAVKDNKLYLYHSAAKRLVAVKD